VTSTAARKLRGSRKASLVSALVLAAAVLAGAAGIAAASGTPSTHAVRATVGLACRFPSGTYQVSAVVAATFPETATVGEAIKPAGLRVTVELPQSAVGDLRKLGAATVSASGLLAVTQTSAGSAVSAEWPARTSSASKVPAAGGMQITAVGAATPAAASRPGTVAFAASGLSLTLSPQSPAGKATSPSTVQADCSDASSTGAQLASVAVSKASPSATASKKQAKPELKFPKGCGDIPVVGIGAAACGYLTGYSDISKLYGATKFVPGLMNIDFSYKNVIKNGNLVAYSRGQLYYQGTEPYYKGHEQLPPVRSTFLTFRFVPVTATVVIIEHGPISIVSLSGLRPPYAITVTATTKVSIHLSDVVVNGKPLDVGPGCQTATLAQFKLTGHGTNMPVTGYTVRTGGPLTGMLTIPAFTHCGVTENLDALMTGTISGPGNYVKMTQGKLCGVLHPSVWFCPARVAKPIR
jgi:hypothetical protein